MIKVYLSHSISNGDESTSVENQRANCKEARRVGRIIQEALPMVEVYIPGGSTEKFVRRAYNSGYISVNQILEIDCEIVSDSDMIVVYAPDHEQVTGGRLVELNHALHEGVPNYVFGEPCHAIQFIDAFFKLGALR